MKRLIGIGLVLGLFLFAGIAQAATISGNTSAGENQPGWLFNRDTGTQTPYEFTLGQASAGLGSLYVPAIGSNPSDKFIAENFLATPIADVASISYDFKLNGSASPAQFYMNVYANFGESSPTKFYDCRYNVVPTAGSADAFTTVTFNPSQPYPVTQSGTSPQPCPAIPAEMNTGSTTGAFIRVIALNVGDTSASDVGVSGYLDNVVVTTLSGATVSDFEPGSIITNSENETYLSLQAAVDGTEAGGTISLSGDVTTTALVLVSKPLTIDGNNHTLFAPIDNTANSNANNAGIGIVGAAGPVVINNLTIDGSGSAKIHGINVFESSNVSLNSVTVKNNTKAGITINGSTVTVNNVTTLNNAWGGINADQAADAPSATVLTVTGSSAHTEAGPDMWRDDNSKQVTVNLNGQYSQANYTHDTDVVGTVFTLIDQVAVSGSNPQVEVTSSTQPISVTVDVSVTQPSLDVSALITTPGKATLPQISIQSDNVDVSIPASTVVTSSDTSWNGIINAPTVVSAPVISASSGQVATAALAIEVGSGDTALTFDQPVKLTFAGQAGKLAGWVRGGVFSTISDVCDNATNPTLVGEECKIDVGADLVVWTKHFTTFVTYTESAKPVSTPSSSAARRASNLASLGGGAAVSTPAASVSAAGGEVLGAFTGPVDLSEVAAIKLQLIGLIQQLIGLLQAQLAVALAAEAN